MGSSAFAQGSNSGGMGGSGKIYINAFTQKTGHIERQPVNLPQVGELQRYREKASVEGHGYSRPIDYPQVGALKENLSSKPSVEGRLRLMRAKRIPDSARCESDAANQVAEYLGVNAIDLNVQVVQADEGHAYIVSLR